MKLGIAKRHYYSETGGPKVLITIKYLGVAKRCTAGFLRVETRFTCRYMVVAKTLYYSGTEGSKEIYAKHLGLAKRLCRVSWGSKEIYAGYPWVEKRFMQSILGFQRDLCRVSGGSKEIYAGYQGVAKRFVQGIRW